MRTIKVKRSNISVYSRTPTRLPTSGGPAIDLSARSRSIGPKGDGPRKDAPRRDSTRYWSRRLWGEGSSGRPLSLSLSLFISLQHLQPSLSLALCLRIGFSSLPLLHTACRSRSPPLRVKTMTTTTTTTTRWAHPFYLAINTTHVWRHGHACMHSCIRSERMRSDARSISQECDLCEIGGSQGSKLLLLVSIY